jgi:hypothetical protein
MGINSSFKGLNRLRITRKLCFSFGWFPCVGIFIRRHFGTLCSVFIGGVSTKPLTPPRRMQQYFETSACAIQTLANHPEERIQHSEHGETLKSRITKIFPMCEQHEQFVVLWKSHWTRNARITRSNGAVLNNGSGKPFSVNSNRSPTRCNHFSVYYPAVYLPLNMFRAFSRPDN